jgi:putative colanic acid biosynthesis UDP-glucose lipid carrier transferase
MQTTFFRTYAVMLATRVLDVLLIAAAGVLAFWWRFDGDVLSIPLPYSVLILITSLSSAIFFPVLGVYHSWRARSLVAPVVRVLGGWSLVFSGVLIGLVLFKESETFSRLWMAQWWLLGGFGLALLRLAVYGLLRTVRARGMNRHQVVVVGDGALASQLIQRTESERWAGFDVVRVFGQHAERSVVSGHEIQPLNELFDYVSTHQIDEVWIAVPFDQSIQLKEVLEDLRFSTANVRFVPDLFGLFLINHGVSEIMDVPMIDLSASPMTGANRLVKGIEDRGLALLILLVISPLLLGIALGVKLSSKGPVLYKQKRHGWDGQPFTIYKFRSMKDGVDEEGEVPQAVKGDSRVTRFGAFLRRTSLDELPQFINVLQGRMSIVGPRPHAVEHNELYKSQIDGYMLRHKVKPGITGWAQINGWRGETDTLDKMQKRIEYDLYYIEHWSLAFDLKIIFLTVFRGFVHKNAY